MNFFYPSKRKELTYEIKVVTPPKAAPIKMVVRVKDPNKKGACYTNRHKMVSGSATFEVRMPQSPDTSLIQVFNAKNGNLKLGQDATFQVALKVKPLQKTLTCFDGDKNITRFVKFAQEFSENAGIISAGNESQGQSIYESDDGKFRIIYSDYIIDNNSVIPDFKTKTFVPNRNFGKRLATPARISQSKGIIEIAKSSFIQYTIPMRMAILLHEFSHFYLNQNPKNEIEADLNALLIYLGMGYPRIEGHDAFLEVFKNSPSGLNYERYEKIKKFIKNFDSYGFVKCA